MEQNFGTNPSCSPHFGKVGISEHKCSCGIFCLTLLRWLLPKGFMSRDQFSQLMLVYTGMAADIAEIFEAFRESKVI